MCITKRKFQARSNIEQNHHSNYSINTLKYPDCEGGKQKTADSSLFTHIRHHRDWIIFQSKVDCIIQVSEPVKHYRIYSRFWLGLQKKCLYNAQIS